MSAPWTHLWESVPVYLLAPFVHRERRCKRCGVREVHHGQGRKGDVFWLLPDGRSSSTRVDCSHSYQKERISHAA